MTTTTESAAWTGGRRLTPADVRDVRFGRATVFHPGYDDTQVDRFLDRVGEELAKLHAEKAELRDRVHDLEARIDGEQRREAPSTQAVGILAAAQQTADQYVAEAEAFSRVVTTEAREHYEDQVRQAREKVGAMIQAAQEAAAVISAQAASSGTAGDDDSRTAAELQEQVVYLQAFSQACRIQLRAYLEALLDDVEREWGAAHPDGVPAVSARPRVQRPPAAAALSGAPAPAVRAPAVPAPAVPVGAVEPSTVEAAAVLLSEDALRQDRQDDEAGARPRQ
ncbi:DivIVA domain-containing protein [Geodermatophilus dictyosporus]|uniref:Cell wall synthesis protein Wag31 n=1 Tax=Geodermatophilus dictyosporus TaxID=1523247 RepID=A0A1I5JH49_9ACTN|nr:DivIVA domain-containing protein [Geodermatophilus dictyosporus]SFO72148.1 DivIVA domain-containing protein [Geodermatophilus dictyosporus]